MDSNGIGIINSDLSQLQALPKTKGVRASAAASQSPESKTVQPESSVTINLSFAAITAQKTEKVSANEAPAATIDEQIVIIKEKLTRLLMSLEKLKGDHSTYARKQREQIDTQLEKLNIMLINLLKFKEKQSKP